MKISPVILLNPRFDVIKTGKNTPEANKNQYPNSLLISYPKEFYFCDKNKTQQQNFEYLPIGLKKASNELVYNYENLKKFSKLYAQKLNAQLMPIEKQDIEKLIDDIKKATNADLKTIKEVLYSLTLFSSYNSLALLEEIFQKEEISRYGLIYFHRDATPPNFSSNGCISYIASQKAQLPYKNGEYGVLILDKTILAQLKKFKNSKNPDDIRTYESIVRQIKSKQIKVLNLIGWDVKCSDEKYRSANFFSGTGYLKDLTNDIIKRIQKGEKLENILCKNNENVLKDILKEDIGEDDIEVISFPNVDDTKEKSVDDIFENLKIKTFSPEKIENIISLYIDKTYPKDYPKKDYQIALCKLLDEQSKVYSADSLAYELKLLYAKISSVLKTKGYEKNDILYCVPDASKSFGLINYMYKRVNEIDEDNIVGMGSYLNTSPNSAKAKVILDDISASGLTQERTSSLLRNKLLSFEEPIYYANLITCDSAAQQTHSPLYKGETIYLTKTPDLGALFKTRCTLSELAGEDIDIDDPRNYVNEYRKIFCEKRFKTITPQDIKILENSLYLGYASSGLSCAFPYMLPDNNNDLASLIFQDILYRNVPEANKTLNVLKMHNPARAHIYYKISNSF